MKSSRNLFQRFAVSAQCDSFYRAVPYWIVKDAPPVAVLP